MDNIDSLTYLLYPFFNFGPKIVGGGFISSLTRKAFAIETTDNYENSFLLLEETLNDEEFFWQDLYKFEDETNLQSKLWNVFVKSQYVDNYKVAREEMYPFIISSLSEIILNEEIFDRLLALNKEYCGVVSH